MDGKITEVYLTIISSIHILYVIEASISRSLSYSQSCSVFSRGDPYSLEHLAVCALNWARFLHQHFDLRAFTAIRERILMCAAREYENRRDYL